MTATTSPYATRHTDTALDDLLAAHARSLLAGALHPDLVTLACTKAEDGYLLTPHVDGIAALGPLPPARWLDEHGTVRTVLDPAALAGLDWRPLAAADLAALDIRPTGAWYAARHTEAGIVYVRHTQGYHDALAAFLASVERRDMPPMLGRAPYVALYPDGHYETGADATEQPVILAIPQRDGLARRPAGVLDDLLADRAWPL